MPDLTYRPSVDERFAQRLDEVAALLRAVRDFKYSLSGLGPPNEASAASHESRSASEALGNPPVGQRAYFLADMWLLEMSHHLAALGALYHHREVFFAPMPLARTILEMSARVVYLLAPAATARERAARALIEDAYASEAMAKAEKRLHGKTDLYKQLRKRVTDLKQEAQSVFGAEPSGGPEEWNVAGQTRIGPSESIRRYGEIQRQARLHEGLYDRLSTYTHPSLGGLLFLDRDDDGRPTGLRIEPDEIEAIAQNSLVFFHQAAKHFVSYAGWQPDPMIAFETEIEQVFPKFFSDEGTPNTP